MKMKSISIIWYYVLLSLFALYSQGDAGEKKLLLFARNMTFLPEIEDILKNLHDYKSGEEIFTEIINVNKWSINRLEEGEIDQLIRYYESGRELRRRSRWSIDRNDSLLNIINQANCYMRIDVLEKLPLLEFQVLISDSLPEIPTGEFRVLVTKLSRFTGFVIDISKDSYMLDFINSVKGLFPRCNRPPIVKVMLNKDAHEDGRYYFGVGREVVINASYSYDTDSDNNELQFSWRQLNPRGEEIPVAVQHKSDTEGL